MAFFDSFTATPDGGRPPRTVTLKAALRTHVGTESIVLRYSLDRNNDVWFHDAPENPGRSKEITFPRDVGSGGTDVTVTAPLLYGSGEQRPSAVIQAAVLNSATGTLMHEADAEIFLR
jgi:hypothetical protein